SAGCQSERPSDTSRPGWLVPTNGAPATSAPPRLTSTIAPAPRTEAGRIPEPLPTVSRSLLGNPQDAATPPPGDGRLYSFSAKDLDIRDALALFARTHDLNVVPDPDVTGSVSVEFKNLALDRAMEAILGSFGYYAEVAGGLIRIRNLRTEFFTIDYLRLIRSGNGSTTANITSGSGSGLGGASGGSPSSSPGGSPGSSGGGGGSGDSTSVSINKSDSVDFWSEIETQLKTLLSGAGKLAINRVAGTIMVTDQKANVDRISDYLRHVKKTLHRQVDLEAQIFEVVLNDEFHFGVDWQNVMAKLEGAALTSGGLGTGIPSSSLMVNNPIGGNTPGQPALSLAISKGDSKVVVDALREMGNLEVVSQPRIRTLNNQAALIKVGTDKPFFRKSTVVTTSNGASQTQTDVEVSTITIGTILSLTPQISDDGWITMDISPVITRLVATATGPDESTAPEVDIKQASSLVRIPQGSTVVIGGLIQNEHSKTVRKVPVLGDIPILGYPFRGVYDNTRKTELVIFITPTIVP
ncbi:MAG: secretin N-terminal domain-containing protein, partial [Verrucomicrobiales bacterium]|nr:secretin N-terminal domain-containing protein [Verrucomicrobiales bacterium]